MSNLVFLSMRFLCVATSFLLCLASANAQYDSTLFSTTTIDGERADIVGILVREPGRTVIKNIRVVTESGREVLMHYDTAYAVAPLICGEPALRGDPSFQYWNATYKTHSLIRSVFSTAMYLDHKTLIFREVSILSTPSPTLQHAFVKEFICQSEPVDYACMFPPDPLCKMIRDSLKRQ